MGGALGGEDEPLRPSTRMGPGEPLREQIGLVQGPRRHTGRSPGLHLAGSHPLGTGARLQRPPAPGGGQGPSLPTQRSRPREKQDGAGIWEMAPPSARQARPGQPRGCHLGGFESPALAMASLLPAPSRAPYWASAFALLVWRICFSKLQWPRLLSQGSSSRPWVSWSLDTGTGLSPLPSCLPNDTGEGWIVRVIGAIIAPFCHHMPGPQGKPLPAFV